jgi:predicted ATPase
VKWHVITAGPSAGKTSVIRELSARGYRTAPEASRLVIDQAVSEGRDIDEYRGTQEFQSDVIDADLRIENNIRDENDLHVFFDRSMVDNIAYAELFGHEIPGNIKQRCRDRYDSVFLLERIEYEDDYARTENGEEAQMIHEKLREVYEELGYTVIDIPLMAVDERAKKILEHAVYGTGVIH